MVGEWHSLQDVVETFIDYRGKTPKKTELGIPLITAKIIKNGTILPPTEFISRDDYDEWMRRGLPQYGDIVITTEAPLGEVAQLKLKDRFALAQRVIALRGKKNILDNTFLKYALWYGPVQGELSGRASGTTVQGIKSSELKKVKIPLPSYSVQKKITDILGTLDDKIELYRCMNDTLEEMAMALYKHWFVDFGPFQDVEFEESEFGLIPKGWKVGTLGDIATTRRESINPKNVSSDTPYIGLEHMPKGSITLSEWDTADKVDSNKFFFKRGDILFGKLRPYFKKVGIAPVDGICSTDMYVLDPLDQDYYGLLLGVVLQQDFIEHCTNSSSGTKMPRSDWSEMKKYPVFLPPEEIVRHFNVTLRDFANQVISNVLESKTLTEIRDYLLPRLLSGDIKVQTAEEKIEEVLSHG